MNGGDRPTEVELNICGARTVFVKQVLEEASF